MSYTLDYTGQEVNNVVGRFTSGGSNTFVEEKRLLWTNPSSITSETEFESQEITISNLSNYNMIEIEFNANFTDHLVGRSLTKIIRLPVATDSKTDVQCLKRTLGGSQSYLKRGIEIYLNTNDVFFTGCNEYQYTTAAFSYADWFLIPTKIYGIKYV